MRQKFRIEAINEKRNYFVEETKQNEFISKKHKTIFKILNYTEQLLDLTSRVAGFVSISAFTS